MANVGYASLQIIPSAKGFASALQKETAQPMTRAGKQGGHRIGGGMLAAAGKVAGPIAAVFAGVQVGGFLKQATLEAEEAASAVAITNQIISQTGGAAKASSGDITKLTRSLSLKTGVDKTLIREGSNVLLTFTKIRNEVGEGNDVFDRANSVALDMSATFGQDMKSSATQLGKALGDPIRGVGALARVGVSFTTQEKEKIKTLQESGDMLGAQKLILEALETQVGGTAEASADSSAKISNVWRELREGIGAALLPLMDSFAGLLIDRVLPAISGMAGAFDKVKQFVGQVVAAFREDGLSGAIDFLLEKVNGALPLIQAKLTEWGQAFIDWIGPRIGPMLEQLGELLRRYATWALTVALPKIVETLSEWAAKFVEWVGPKIPPLLRELGELLRRVGEWMVTVALPELLSKLSQWAQEFVAWVAPKIPPLLRELGGLLGSLLKWLATEALPAIVTKLGEWAAAFFQWVPGAATSLLVEAAKLAGKLTAWILTEALPAIETKLAEWAAAFVAWVATAIRDLPGKLAELGATLLSWASEVPGLITDGVGDLGRLLWSAGRDVVSGLWDGIKSLGGWLAEKVGSFVRDRVTNAAKSLLGIASPSRVFADIGRNVAAGMAVGIEADTPRVTRAMGALTTVPDAAFEVRTSSGRPAVGATGHGDSYEALLASVDSLRREIRRQTDRGLQLTKTGAVR